MEWKDVIAKAPTGTGKTFAFGIPMVEHIDPECADVQGLVLAPTRELAVQIQEELRDLCEFKEGVRTVCLYGGAPIDRQINTLKKKPQIVVATPGRLMDHMKRRTVRLDKVQTVVLDEADRMLDMGFVRDVTRILDQLKHRRNLGMFSATISREVMDISWVYQRDPVEITVRPVEESKPDITQYRIDLDGREQKLDTIAALITHGEYERAIAFCNTKNMTDRLAGLLKMRGISCEAIHGDIQQRIREKTLEKFKRGEIKVLVATDVAARGLDIDDVDAVFNYDVPDDWRTTPTASAAPAGPSATVWPTPSSPPSPRASAWMISCATPRRRCSGSDTTPTAASCWWRTANNFHGFLRKPEGLFNPSRGILCPEFEITSGGFSDERDKKAVPAGSRRSGWRVRRRGRVL